MDETAVVGQRRPAPARLSQGRLSQGRLGQIVSALAARPDRWRELVPFAAGRRWYQRLELADGHEVWLLSWLPGQCTGFHDHGQAAGAFAVAQGRVRERTVAAGGRPPARNLTVAQERAGEPAVAAGGRPPVRDLTVAQGGVRAFGPHHVHDVVNAFAEPAVTVHAYSPPLTAMRRFELTEAGLVHTATERAEQDW